MRVGFEVIELDMHSAGAAGLGFFLLTFGCLGHHVLPNAFPVANANRLLAEAGRKFTIEERASWLALAEQRRGAADAIHIRGGLVFAASQLKQSGQPVFETYNAVSGRAGNDAAFPRNYGRFVDPSLVERAFTTTEASRGVEKIDAFAGEGVEDWAIVGRE